MAIKEKVAYLSGLMDGVELDKDSKEGRLFDAILDVLEEIADEVDTISEDLEELEEFVEALDEDVDDLEDLLDIDEDKDDDEDEEEDDLVRLKCPACGHVNTFDPKILWESDEEDVEVLCSNCEAVVFSSDLFGGDFDDDEDEDDDF